MKIFALAITLAALILPLTGQTADQVSQDNQENSAQTTKPAAKKTPPARTVSKARPKGPRAVVKDDNAAFEAASAIENPAEKLAALKKFVEEYPESSHLDAAREAIVSTALSLGDERLLAGDAAAAVGLYKTAINSTPQPIPDALFNDTLSKIPNSLYWRGYRAEGLEVARALEPRVDKNAGQLATLATFYIGIENGGDASRIAEMAVAVDPNSSNAYQTLGIARRVNFQLEESAAAYAKALELSPDSAAAKRSLADMKRALGHTDEALQLYRDLVTADASDVQSRTGLVLTLFDAGKRADAETEMAAALEQNPNNIVLLAGAAYWYAANNDGDKAVELGRKAVAIEPRYIWSHIALARGLMAQNRPVDAEETLLRARQYGRFPTIDYEIAAARYKAGFFREAAEELEKSFSASGDTVQTRLGGRVQQSSPSFIDLLANERRASILEPAAADDEATAAGLKALLAFQSKLKGSASPAEIAAAADAFAAGDDKMKLHRELYAASMLLDKNVAPEKAFELTEAAIGKTDEALEIPGAASAVMASELYDSRTAAIERDEFIRVPDVPRQTLSAILRGRVEELAGWALMQRDDPAEAVIRLRRAVSVMPPKSAWSRSSLWRLGDALRAEGNEKEALDSYIKSYSTDKPDLVRYTAIETLYKKLNGSTEGLEAKIGPGPLPGISPENLAKAEPKSSPEESPTPAQSSDFTPAPVRLPRALPVATPTPQPAVPTAVSETPPASVPAETVPEAAIAPSPSPSPELTPEATPQPTPETVASPTPEAAASPSPEPTVAATPEPTATPEASPTPAPEPTVETATPRPTPEATPTPEPEPTVQPSPEPTATPEPPGEPAATPTPDATPSIETAVAQNIPPTPAQPEPTPDTAQPPAPLPEPSPSQPNEAKTIQPNERTPTGTARRAGTPKVVITENIPPARRAPSANSPPGGKSLFEPVLIAVPGTEHKKPETRDREVKDPVDAPTEQPEQQPPPDKEPGKNARVEITDTLPGANSSREVRPRITNEERTPPIAQCSVTTSDERLTLMKNGGSLGLLVGVGSPGDLRDVKATPSSTEDLRVTREAPITGLEDRAVFSVKAVGTKPGIYKVIFEVPCGRHQITINVR
jgi:tetratricopeptide (TPR) repeat protein